MTHQDPNQAQTGIAKQEATQERGMTELGALDFQELFQFEDQNIILDDSEAWWLKGKIRPFGHGTLRLGRAMGVELLRPTEIVIDGVRHPNPHLVRDADGTVIGIYIVKYGVAVAREGIRYVEPTLDYVQMRAVYGAMAFNTYDKVVNVQDAAKMCNRAAYDKLNADAATQGLAGWFFLPTIDNNTGIAFNMSERGDAGKEIQKLQKNVAQTQSAPGRKVDTATDRRIIEKLFPEILTAIDYGSVQKDGIYFKKGTWTVSVPTANPIARTMIAEFGKLLHDNDPDVRERKLGEIMGVLGGDIQVKAISAGTLTEDEVAGGYKTIDAEEVPTISPVPLKMTVKEIKEFIGIEFRKMATDEKNGLLEASGCENWEAFREGAVHKDNKDRIHTYLINIGGVALEGGEVPLIKDDGEITPDYARGQLTEYLAENDGKPGVLEAIFGAKDLDLEADFKLIPDEDILEAYTAFVHQMSQQEPAPTEGEETDGTS